MTDFPRHDHSVNLVNDLNSHQLSYSSIDLDFAGISNKKYMISFGKKEEALSLGYLPLPDTVPVLASSYVSYLGNK